MSAIAKVFQDSLGVTMPASYLRVVETYGAELALDPIHQGGIIDGLGSAEFAIGTTLSLRSAFPELPGHFVVIAHDGSRLLEKINESVDVYLLLNTLDATIHRIDSLGKRMPVGKTFDRWIAPRVRTAELRTRYRAHLVVLVFDRIDQTERLRTQLKRLQAGRLLHLKDAVVVVRDQAGKLRVSSAAGGTGRSGAARGLIGALWRSLSALPVVGAALRWVKGSGFRIRLEPGLDPKFVQEVAAGLGPETSALFILMREAKLTQLLEALRGFGGRLLLSSLSADQELALQAALGASSRGGRPTAD